MKKKWVCGFSFIDGGDDDDVRIFEKLFSIKERVEKVCIKLDVNFVVLRWEF